MAYYKRKEATFRLPLRAENETRTRDPDLGKVVLYQLSYFRKYLCYFKDSFSWNGTAKIRQKSESPNIFAIFLDSSTSLRSARNDKGGSLGTTGGLARNDRGYPTYFAMSRTRRSLRGSTWKSPTEASMWSPPTPLSSVRKT